MELVERARRLCTASLTDRLLRERLLSEIGRRIPFDGHVFAMIDPASGVVSSPHATLPMVPSDRLQELIARRYVLSDRQEWAAWLGTQFGVTDVASVPLRDRYGAWGFLELWRTRTTFGKGERDTVTALARVLTTGLRDAVARTFAPSEHAADSAGMAVVEPCVILLDGDLRVRTETGSAATALLRLLPGDYTVPPVPAVAFNVGGALLAAELEGRASEDTPPVTPGAWARVHLGGGQWMTARADRLADDIAVTISPCTAPERVDLYARSHGLSRREVDVLDHVLRGLDSRTIADSLTIAPTTAEDHVRSLLAKTGSRSRQHLIAQALNR